MLIFENLTWRFLVVLWRFEAFFEHFEAKSAIPGYSMQFYRSISDQDIWKYWEKYVFGEIG